MSADHVPSVEEITAEYEAEQRLAEALGKQPLIDGFVWVSWRGMLTIGAMKYPRGCPIPREEILKLTNFRALIDGDFVKQVPPSKVVDAIKPIAVENTQPSRSTGNPPITIIHDPDAVLSWNETVSAMAGQMGGDTVRAKDLLMTDPHGARLCKAAIRIDAERRAIRDKTTGRRIVSAP